jgi:hypothetical protein
MVKQIPSQTNFDQIYDVLKKDSDLWDLFTKKEEYTPKKLDEHGRFPYEFSSHKNVLFPSVSAHLIHHGFHAEYPDHKKFALILTHDVDDVYVTPHHLWYSALYFPRNRNLLSLFNLGKGFVNRKRTPYLNFRKIIEIEKIYGATSSFYFLASPHDIFGWKYTLEDLEGELKYILDRNCEIGFHTGYYSYNDLDRVMTEKKEMERVIGEKVIGARNHVLRFKTPDSWNLLMQAGFRYDSSFGYHDTIGFRNGMCHPFQPFNITTCKKIDILEIPLHVQDWTLFRNMKMNISECWTHIKNLIDSVEKYNGILVLLWHTWTFSLPTSIGGIFGNEWTRLYEKILQYGHEKNAWITNCKELCKYSSKNTLLKKTM